MSRPVARSERLPAGSVPVLGWPELATGVADVVVTTRHGGVSTGPYESLNLGLHVGDEVDAVVENRRRGAAAIGLDLDQLVFARQSHGRSVAVVTTADRGRGTTSDDDALADVDALVTVDPDVGLVVLVADCVPIVLLDAEAGVLAAVHAGWRGTVARVVAAAVEVMVERGARPGQIVAGIGPAIAAARYQVGAEVAEAAEDALGGDAASVVRPDGTGRFTFDLPAANRRLLLAAGLDAAHILRSPATTGGHELFSDREQRPCGRFGLLARVRR